MTRLAHHQATIARAQKREECVGYARHKVQRRRQLHEQRPALSAKARALVEKSLDQRTHTPQFLIVRNRARNLYRKAELRRRAARPFRIRCGAVRSMKDRKSVV